MVAALVHTRRQLARIERLLELRLAAGGLDAEPVLEPFELLVPPEAMEDAPLALLAERFGLHRVELDTLALLAGVELSERVARLLGSLRGGTRHGFVDPQLALALFAADPLEAIALAPAFDAGGTLFRAGLVRAVPVKGFPPYRAAECLVLERHVLYFLAGRRELGGDLEAIATRIVPALRPSDLPGAQPLANQLAQTMRGFYRLPRAYDLAELEAAPEARERYDYERGVVLEVSGEAGSGRRMLVRAAAQAVGRAVLELDAGRLAAHEDWADLLKRTFAQAELYGEVVHLRHAQQLPVGGANIVHGLIERHAVVLVVTHDGTSLTSPLADQVVLRLRTATRLPVAASAQIWARALPVHATLRDPALPERIAETHPLTPGQVRQAVRLATMWSSELRQSGEPVVIESMVLQGAAAAQRATAPSLLTTEVKSPTRALADVVLTDDKRAELQSIIDACAHRREVLQVWGFERVLKRGTGIICLFDGPPGTGKTLTAEVLASELRLELHQINVARVVDKYIGETEKNLEQLFERAIPERTLLLFDEADSLFGTRVKVSTSTDRYANMAINTLLQLIERYTGVVILTTNLKEALDPAFERRITYKVKFERPDVSARRELWRAHIPSEAPLDGDVDIDTLAEEFELSGGHIKNAVLRAALASAKAGRITQALLFEQAAREASSMGMLVRRPLG